MSIQKKIEGTKTTTATVVWLLMRIVDTIRPGTIPVPVADVIYLSAEILATIGITDKLWRNRHKLKSLFKWKKKEKDS